MDVIENIKKYGNKDKDYVPHEFATCYPLHSQDFVRTGFQDISYTLASRDYKDPKCVIVKRSDEMIIDSQIVAMRGRNPENPSDRTVGAPTEQRLEPNSQGICNTLTSVQKDNLVMEVKQLGFMDNGTGQHQSNTVYDENALCPNITTIQGGGTQQIKVLNQPQYRIRKLTPLECWRLMDFSDEDFFKAAQVNSNTQLYKQAGNSICRNVLVAIIGQMIPGKENVYKENTK